MFRIEGARKKAMRLGAAFVGVVAVGAAVSYIPDFLRPAHEVAVSQSEGLVVVSTSKPVLFKDRRLQDVLDQIREKCSGEIITEVQSESVIRRVHVKTDKEKCALILNDVRIGIYSN